MGTTAHVRIHTDGSPTGAGVYHRFDGDTLGPLLADLGHQLNARTDTAVTAQGFARAWVDSQNASFHEQMSRFPDPTGRGAEIAEQMARTSIELVDEEEHVAVPDWYSYFYTVAIIDGRVRSVTGQGDQWGPETVLVD